jgi:hypothetical protein
VKILVPEKKGDTPERSTTSEMTATLGLISLLSGDPSPFIIVAEEDTICYLVKRMCSGSSWITTRCISFHHGPSKGFKQFDSGAVSPRLVLSPNWGRQVSLQVG